MARSPGVEAFEFDATVNVVATGDSGAAMAGSYTWGPCEQAIQLSSIDDLLAIFGKPNNDNYQDWFSASNFLNYSASLYNVRVVDDATALNAGVAPTSNPQTGDPLVEAKGILFKNSQQFEMAKLTSAQLKVVAKSHKLNPNISFLNILYLLNNLFFLFMQIFFYNFTVKCIFFIFSRH